MEEAGDSSTVVEAVDVDEGVKELTPEQEAVRAEEAKHELKRVEEKGAKSSIPGLRKKEASSPSHRERA